jgi:hypothetical protein
MKTIYELVASHNHIAFTAELTIRLNNGWKLQGGVAIFGESFVQAVTKEVPDETN